ncbi:MAG TPA: hypothetical protein VG478_08500 [Acidimicrobiales bacterium]|nr:hypothetical protein [Acidimicrobiales bacterium]
MAVAFRSFPRRLREALALAEGDPARTRAAKDRAAELDRIVQDAAATVGASAGADLAAGTEAVAQRIQSIEPDEWDESRLERLRQLALDGGRILREVEAAARAD